MRREGYQIRSYFKNKPFSVILLFVAIMLFMSILLHTGSSYAIQPANGNKIWLYSQIDGDTSSIACLNSNGNASTLESSGCQVYTYAHAIQWLTGEKRDSSNHKQLLSDILAQYNKPFYGASAYQKYVTEGDYSFEKKSRPTTESDLQSHFSQGGVVICNSGGHYCLAVGCTSKDINGDGKKELLVHIVDSTAWSTLKRLNNNGYATTYTFASFEPVTWSYVKKNYNEFKGGKEYWITFEEYKNVMAKGGSCPAFLPGDGKRINPLDYGNYTTIKTLDDAFYSVVGAVLDPSTGKVSLSTSSAAILSVAKALYQIDGIPIYDYPCKKSSLVISISSIKNPTTIFNVCAIVEYEDVDQEINSSWIKSGDNTFIPAELLEFQYQRTNDFVPGTYVVTEPNQTQWGYFPFDAEHKGIDLLNDTEVFVAGAVKNKHGSIWYQLDSITSNKWVYSGHLTLKSAAEETQQGDIITTPTPSPTPSDGSQYAGWYEVVNVNQYMSIRSAKSSSGQLISNKAVLGSYVHMTDADAPAGTAKKWGHVDCIVLKDGTQIITDGYACVYYMKATSFVPTIATSTPTAAPVTPTTTYNPDQTSTPTPVATPTPTSKPTPLVMPEPAEQSYNFSLPTSIRIIEDSAFEGIGVESIKIADGIQIINSYSFANCDNLTSIYIPGSVVYIASDAFDDVESERLTIYGRGSSSAAIFAKNHGYTFIPDKGSPFTLDFDANGGSCSEESISLLNGYPVGVLPIPSRDYYTFDGWYTEPLGGALITSDSILYYPISCTVYAHWSENSLSDWVLISDVPAEAITVTTKTQYQYRDMEFTAWSAWSSWSTSSETIDNALLKEQQTATIYPWYYYTCPNCGYHNKLTKTSCSSCKKGSSSTSYAWHGPIWTTQKWTVSSTSDSAKVSYTETEYDYGLLWSYSNHQATGVTNSANGYRYRTRASSWGTWTAWSDTPVSSSTTREVNTRIMVKYRSK